MAKYFKDKQVKDIDIKKYGDYRIRTISRNAKQAPYTRFYLLEDEYFHPIYSTMNYRIKRVTDKGKESNYISQLPIELTEKYPEGIEEFRMKAVSNDGLETDYYRLHMYFDENGNYIPDIELEFFYLYDIIEIYIEEYLSEIFITHKIDDTIYDFYKGSTKYNHIFKYEDIMDSFINEGISDLTKEDISFDGDMPTEVLDILEIIFDQAKQSDDLFISKTEFWAIYKDFFVESSFELDLNSIFSVLVDNFISEKLFDYVSEHISVQKYGEDTEDEFYLKAYVSNIMRDNIMPAIIDFFLHDKVLYSFKDVTNILQHTINPKEQHNLKSYENIKEDKFDKADLSSVEKVSLQEDIKSITKTYLHLLLEIDVLNTDADIFIDEDLHFKDQDIGILETFITSQFLMEISDLINNVDLDIDIKEPDNLIMTENINAVFFHDDDLKICIPEWYLFNPEDKKKVDVIASFHSYIDTLSYLDILTIMPYLETHSWIHIEEILDILKQVEKPNQSFVNTKTFFAMLKYNFDVLQEQKLLSSSTNIKTIDNEGFVLNKTFESFVEYLHSDRVPNLGIYFDDHHNLENLYEDKVFYQEGWFDGLFDIMGEAIMGRVRMGNAPEHNIPN